MNKQIWAHIPPLFPWQWSIIGYLLGIFLPSYPVLSSLAFMAIIFSPIKKRTLLFIFVGMLVALPLSLHRIAGSSKDNAPINNSPTLLKARVYNIFTYPTHRASIALGDIKIFRKGKWIPVCGKIIWRIRQAKEIPLPGEEIYGRLKIKKLHPLKNPGSPGILTYYKSQGITYITWSRGIPNQVEIRGQPNWWWKVRNGIRQRLDAILSSMSYRGIIAALLNGDRRGISPNQMRTLREAGLSHLIAQSGLHVGFVALLGWLLGYIPTFIKPKWYLYIPRPVLSSICAIIFVGLYYFISFPSPSLLRATLMVLCAFFLFILGHKSIIWDSLFLSLLIILILNPFSPYQLSFQLSYLALIGILFFAPVMVSPFIQKGNLNKAGLYLTSLMAMSISANIFILPLLIWKFGSISLSLYTNILFIPAVAFLIMPLIIGGLFLLLIGLSPIAHLCFLSANNLLEAGFSLLYHLKKYHLLWYIPVLRPHPIQLAGFYILLLTICLLILRKNPKKALLVLAIICMFIPPLYLSIKNKVSPRIEASILDVGQGQAILITTPHKRILVDGGGTWDRTFDFGERILSPVLCYMHLPHLDKVFLTHGDIDHLGGLIFILRKFHVGGFYFSGIWPKEKIGKYLKYILTKRHIPIYLVKEGDIISLEKNINLQILNPPSPFFYKKRNNSSLVLTLTYNQKHKNIPLILITSDIEKKAIYHILSKNIQGQVIVVPHHGSKTSFVAQLYLLARPKLCVVSCGYKNRFGFPWNGLVHFLQKRHIPLYGTYKNGCVCVRWPLGPFNMKITTYDKEE